MRAAVLVGLNKDLEIRTDVELTPTGPGEVHLKIIASGVCHSDLSAQNGTLGVAIPTVLGHEGAGIVLDVGPGVDDIAVGDHAIIAFTPSCRKCRSCLRGQPSLCETFISMVMTPHFITGGETITGMTGCGTFADEVVVPANAVVKIDADIPLDVAALIGCGVTTGVGAAINTARITPGSSVVVFGAGGVGIAAIQGARIAGAAEIVAVDRVPAKLEMAKSFGATHVAMLEEFDAIKQEITGGEGFDFALECVGLPVLIRATYDAVRRGGTAVIVGVGRPTEKIEFNAFELFFGEKNLRGSVFGSSNVHLDFHRLLRLWKYGKLDLEGMISRRLPLEQVNEAFRAMEAGEVIRSVIEL